VIAVTGATGHVGNVLVRELARRGEQVRAVVPEGERRESIAVGSGVEVVTGDVREFESLVRAFDGADVVFHLAGIITISSGRRGLLNEVNVLGTRNVVRACRQAGVRRLVYTSSVHALPEPPHGTPVCETGEFTPDALLGDYAQSKARASIEVLEGVRQGLDAVLVFPSGIIGPFDFRGSEMGELILDIARGRLGAYVDGAYDFVDVRDVVQGLVLAAEKGRAGEGYILSGEKITVRDLLTLVGDAVGVRARPTRLPMWLARVAAVFAPLYYRLARRRPRFTAYSLKVLLSNCVMNRGKAERELGYSPRPLRQALRETVDWLRQTGRLQPSGVVP
jgi:dihydroflavonol-4-reductase